jgi:hypothetical protein
MNPYDSLNRTGTLNEKLLADTISSNNKVAKLVDAYRVKHKEEGYTWKRGTCFSRLDYIFVSTSMTEKINKADYDWSFEASDHAAVKIELKLPKTPGQGPGIPKVNTSILEDPKLIGREIKTMLDQTDKSWNSHLKLEFLKVAIRTTIAGKVAEIRKNNNNKIKETEEEINQLIDLKIKLLSNREEINTSRLDIAVSELNKRLAKQRQETAKIANFKSRAKWFEYREKSNKFFLNLNKFNKKKETY